MKAKTWLKVLGKLPSLLGFLYRKFILRKPSKELSIQSANNFLTAVENQTYSDSWMEEQVQIRMQAVFEKSPDCILQGRCVNCGCDIPDKFYEPAGCDSGCYGPLPEKTSKQDYEQQQQNGD